MTNRTLTLLVLTAIVSISACGRIAGEPIERVGKSTIDGEDPTGTSGSGSMGAGGTCGSTGSGGPTCGVITSAGPTVCPVQWTPELSDQLPCNMPSGTICHYQEPTGWRACACGCQDEFRFSCYGHTGWGDCPASQPTPGDACAQKAGCEYFPDTECDCNSQGKWECHTEPLLTWECLDPASNVPPPSCIATDQHVKDLSDADMQAWCQWYMNEWPPGNKAASNFLDGNGYVIGGASKSRTDPFMCIQHLSVEYCKANLQISQCDATLGQVEECVRTLWNDTLLVGHGCAPLQECGCESTIVQFAQLSSMASCGVPIQ